MRSRDREKDRLRSDCTYCNPSKRENKNYAIISTPQSRDRNRMYQWRSLTLEMRRGWCVSQPPCMRKPQGDPPKRVTSLALIPCRHRRSSTTRASGTSRVASRRVIVYARLYSRHLNSHRGSARRARDACRLSVTRGARRPIITRGYRVANLLASPSRVASKRTRRWRRRRRRAPITPTGAKRGR